MPPRVRKIPIRTCVVCQQPQGKRDLLRIVRTPAGEVQVDPSGKRPGRGAYICSRLQCRSGAQAQKQLSRALGTTVSGESLAAWFQGVEVN